MEIKLRLEYPLPDGSTCCFFSSQNASPGWGGIGSVYAQDCTSAISEIHRKTSCNAQKHEWTRTKTPAVVIYLSAAKLHHGTEAPRFLRSWDGKAALAGNECAGVGSFCTWMFGKLAWRHCPARFFFWTNVSIECLRITGRLPHHGIMRIKVTNSPVAKVLFLAMLKALQKVFSLRIADETAASTADRSVGLPF